MFVRSDHEKLKELEDEQEELNGSLLALTSHFAQVPIMIATYWVIWRYCRCLKRISFKNIWPQIFWVLWQGIFYIVLENPWNYLHCLRLVVHVFIWSIPSRKSGKGGQILHFTFHSCFRAHLQVVINAYGMFENYYIEFTIRNSCSRFIRKQLYTAKSLSYMLSIKLSTFIILVTWHTAIKAWIIGSWQCRQNGKACN